MRCSCSGPAIFFILRCSYSGTVLFIFYGVLIQAPSLFIFLFLDCAIDLNLLSNKDMEKLRNGQMFKNGCNSLSIRMALGVINFCVNMLNVD